ncbi:MAG: hypothetical protein PHF08_02480 [Candidatus Riflebacteria bacterium]|jgi:hypothetical protein|nr:hypothetical protein [Candidatus Riflebacteria bacterium]MDD2623502.1 hypothetical protein [Candidatus Riflebacteria bacterium]MDD3376300.1 hypothetical protein [Candidatus Riflebacteria bacterium]NLV94883.1 hypothetical protein [Candidatus Riflebacteria bacterium]
MKILLDLEFNQTTGETRIVVEVIDTSLSTIELNEEIRSGNMLKTVLKEAEKMFGKDLVNRVKDGSIKAICLDNHPELKNNSEGILISEENEVKSGKILLNQ